MPEATSNLSIRKINGRLSLLSALLSADRGTALLAQHVEAPHYRYLRSRSLVDRLGSIIGCSEMRLAPVVFGDVAEAMSTYFAAERPADPVAIRDYLAERRLALESGEACSAASVATVAACYLLLCDAFEHALEGKPGHRDVLTLVSLADALSPSFVDGLCAHLYPYEALLEEDPASLYASMSGAAKAQYREIAETIATQSATSVPEVLATTIRLATSSRAPEARHIGTFLLGERRVELLNALGVMLMPARRPPRPIIYMLVLATIAGTVAAAVVWPADLPANFWALRFVLWLSACALIYDFLSEVARHLYGNLRDARIPCSMERDWAPARSCETVIGIPLLLRSARDFDKVLDGVVEMCLGLRNSRVETALLADFPDSDVDRLSLRERETLDHAIRSVEARNSELLRSGFPTIGLFYRDRVFAARERKWWGAGRKAGKVQALLALLAGDPSDLRLVSGISNSTGTARFLIVLDEDGWIDRTGVMSMISQALHPLNRPILDSEGTVVIAGTAALAPFTSAPPEERARPFASLLMGPYIHPFDEARLRDNNHDLWGQRQFSGKGLLDIRAASTILPKAVDASTVLSHDLVEGAYLRCSFAQGVVVRDGVSSDYGALLSRRERWTRGDLQNLAMLLRPNGPMKHLPHFGRYLIAENARRALHPLLCFAALAAIVALETALSSSYILLAIAMPLITAHVIFLIDIASEIRDGTIVSRLRGNFSYLRYSFQKWLVSIVVAPHLALVTVASSVRAAVRISRNRNLLEWRSFRDSSSDMWSRSKWAFLVRTTALLALAFAALKIASGEFFSIGLLLLGMWCAAPVLIGREERPPRMGNELRRTA